MVSIIVPIYKVEEYLSQCIDSILYQTYSDLEIILVDDGSPDNCGSICEEYAKKDKRIKVIHKENQGLGMARNTGLEYAKGEFIYFVDSDDWLEPNAIECLVKYQKEYDADIVMCNYDKRDDLHKVLYQYRIVNNVKIYSNLKEIEENVFWPMIGQPAYVCQDFTINMCVWTNLYRRELIEQNKIRFLSERDYLSEDICFNLQYLLQCNTAVMIPQSLYCYRYNPNSLTNRYKGDEYLKACKLYLKVGSWADSAKNQSVRDYRVQRFFITKVRELLFRLCCSNISFKEKKHLVENIVNDTYLQETLREYPLENYILKYRIPAQLMKHRCKILIIIMFGLLKKAKG